MADQTPAAAHVTRGFHPRLALVFDFDLTLSDGTVDALLAELGVEDDDRWRREELKPMLDDGWDETLARAHLLARTAEGAGRALTRELVEQVGRGLEPYPGLAERLPALRRLGHEASGGCCEVELTIVSSGFVDLMTCSPVAELFDNIWGSSLHWGDDGELLGVKRTITHSEKARYLRALAKGLDIAGANEPADVEMHKAPEDWHVPFSQMVYVGDGASDIAAFELVERGGGVAIAINQSDSAGGWKAAEHMFDEARVENLAAPDYRDGTELSRSLELATEIVAKRAALRKLGAGE